MIDDIFCAGSQMLHCCIDVCRCVCGRFRGFLAFCTLCTDSGTFRLLVLSTTYINIRRVDRRISQPYSVLAKVHSMIVAI